MLALAAAGGALEFYDFVIFVFLADLIGVLFFPPGLPLWLTNVQTLGIFAAGYVFRPLGGVVLAHFGDIFGRKRVFAFSILLMALSTLAVGLLPSYQSIGIAAPLLLIVLRILQGIAIGGEVPGAWTFVAEHISSRQVGLACGVVCAGLGLGVFFGAATTALMSWVFTPATMLSYGWRLPFILGGGFGLVGVQLRRMLQETPIFLALRARKLLVPELPLKVVVTSYPRGVAVSMLCTWILSAGVVMLTLMVPTILERSYHFDHQAALIAAAVSAISLTVSVGFAGLVVDRIGPARFFILGGVVLALGDVAFVSISWVDPSYAYLLCALVGLSGGVVTGVPVAMVSCFPAAVRFSGVSFSYNVSYAVFGGLTPVVLTALLPLYPFSHAYYLLFISVLTLLLGAYFSTMKGALRHGRRSPSSRDEPGPQKPMIANVEPDGRSSP